MNLDVNVKISADNTSLKGQLGKVVEVSGHLFLVRMPHYYAPIWWRKEDLEFVV